MAEYVSYIYQIIDKFSPSLRNIERANDHFNDKMEKMSAGFKRYGVNMAKVKDTMMGFGVAAGAALTVAAKKSMDFESVMTDVGKVVNFTSKDQFNAFRENILKTSVGLGKLPKNLAEIAVAGGKLGVAVSDMDDFIGVVARTSVAFDMLESEAGDQIGSIQAKLGLTVKETGNLMDAVNFLADNTSASGSRMINIIARTSGELKGIEMPTKFMAGWAAFSDMMEVTAENAASGLNMMIQRLQRIPGMTAKLVEKPQETIATVLKTLSKMDKIKRIEVIDKLFGPEAGRFVKKAVVNMQKFDEAMALVGDDTKFTGSMMKELEKKLATSETAWGKVKAIIDVVGITIGDVLTPYIKDAAPKIVNLGFAFRDWAKTHPAMLKLGVAIAAISAALVPILLIAGVLGGPLTAIGLAIVGIGAAIFEVQQNWDYLVADFKIAKDDFLAFFDEITGAFNFMKGNLEKGLSPEAAERMKIKTDVSGAASSFWEQLKKDFGFGEKGVAAQNAQAQASSVNGSIVVSAKPGSKVESAGLKSTAPGNLGFNLMGATP